MVGRFLSQIAVVVLILVGLRTAEACPICGQPTVTLSERYARAEAALLVSWVSAKVSDAEKVDSTTYEIVEISRAGDGKWKKGERLTVDGYHEGKPGSLVLLMGNKTESGKIKWDNPPVDVSETSYQYIIQAPSPEISISKRLEYFVRFLEYPDPTIANDAFSEFVNAPAEEIAAVASKFPREKLRRWLVDEKLPLARQAGYGLMLGHCGNSDDARFLEKRILDTSGERRFGIEGLMVGYLLLTKEAGLEVIERTKLRNAMGNEGEALAAQVAIRYFWTYGNGSIPRFRLVTAIRILLDNPTLSLTALTDLTRWKDWELQPRLMELYGTKGYDDAEMKTAIINFLIASTKDVPKGAESVPEHAREAEEFLSRLRERDPKLVAQAEKFFPVK